MLTLATASPSPQNAGRGQQPCSQRVSASEQLHTQQLGNMGSGIDPSFWNLQAEIFPNFHTTDDILSCSLSLLT